MIHRGSVYWADLGPTTGSRPAKHRPVVVIQAAPFNNSRIATVIVAAITSNTALSSAPGNVFLPAAVSGLSRDSTINVSQLVTLNKTDLDGPIGAVPEYLLPQLDDGLRLVLGLT
ncbi:mRNA interferase MazF [Stackebrandtia albiflava]|uniref:mRNA interferase n=1 Tax=Stackebrandtia albiflava TaxID=406432 RepID=A0A562UY97_9ACTN|nr:type II toxin-antitoxin system PemK/MazF family toxin [Stackebrandtia albiflava]TWJ10577.1 mRNA interferase MazF [Stackebrandtia albiflava]